MHFMLTLTFNSELIPTLSDVNRSTPIDYKWSYITYCHDFVHTFEILPFKSLMEIRLHKMVACFGTLYRDSLQS